ncbi:MAG: hypothetical protein M9911_00170 [Saprospiraceae bacterium]|nr:hypothetical protein [Saprospiraceae bacterium]
MRKLILFCLTVGLQLSTYAQSDTKVSNIIEGGKVLLEFTKLFVGNKSADKKQPKDNNLPCVQNLTLDASFQNNGVQVVKVRLILKTTQAIAGELVMQPGKREVLYELKEGVYTYEIIDNTTSVMIRKGDIRYEHCENITTTIN